MGKPRMVVNGLNRHVPQQKAGGKTRLPMRQMQDLEKRSERKVKK